QLNGYAGGDFNLRGGVGASGTGAALQVIFDRAAASGTALLCPTITTNSREAMTASLSNLSCALDEAPSLARRVPGVHVEGPYISPEDGPRGAHPLTHVRPPDWAEFRALQDAAGGRIRLLTLAPEAPGALPFIEKLAAAGVVVCIGHTAASPAQIRDAVS